MNEQEMPDDSLENDNEVIEMLKRITRQLDYLEKKVDALMSQGPQQQRPSYGGHGQGPQGGRHGGGYGRPDRGPRPGGGFSDRGPRPGGGFRSDFNKGRRFDRSSQGQGHGQGPIQGPGMHQRGSASKGNFRPKKGGFFHKS